MKTKLLAFMLIAMSLYGHGIYQVSTYKALEEGVYDGEVRYGDLFKKGDFGIGTFNGTNGEMVALDGMFYQDSPNGSLSLVAPTEKTPFAVVTFFQAEKTVKLSSARNFKHFGMMLNKYIEKENTPYAIKITGSFRHMKLRALRRQEPPYQKLAIAAKGQHEYEFYDIEGTLVGYWFPEYLDGVNFGGYHFHFIDKSKSHGGHVLDFSIKSGIGEFMSSETLTIDFIDSEAFNSADLEKN